MPKIMNPIVISKQVYNKTIKKRIGDLHVEEKEAHFKLSRLDVDYFSEGAWKIYTQLLNYLVQERYTIVIKDADTKWEFRIDSSDFLYHSTVKGKHSCVKADQFEVIKAKNRTSVTQCHVLKCSYNFGAQCLKGGIQLDEEGRCKWL